MRITKAVGAGALFLVLLLSVQCSQNPTGSPGDGATNPAPLDKGSPVEESSGNCLSYPVIWSDGVTKSLRGTFGETLCAGPFTDADDPETVDIDIMRWYHQGEATNEWQAESRDQLPLGPLEVTRIDWGDNLEAKSWTEHSIVRVETVLYQQLEPGDEMIGYRMLKLNDAMGLDELWGTNGHSSSGCEATVYSGCARLVIQKLTKQRDDPTLALSWNADIDEWAGDVGATVFNGAVWEGGDGPGYYSGEINVQGKVIYGYNWFVRNIDNAPGDYRITFSLDGSGAGPTLNTYFSEATFVQLPEEEPEEPSDDDGSGDNSQDNGEPDLGGGTAVIDVDNNLTYIDVRIVASSSGGSRK